MAVRPEAVLALPTPCLTFVGTAIQTQRRPNAGTRARPAVHTRTTARIRNAPPYPVLRPAQALWKCGEKRRSFEAQLAGLTTRRLVSYYVGHSL